jgi:hypothetical protein
MPNAIKLSVWKHTTTNKLGTYLCVLYFELIHNDKLTHTAKVINFKERTRITH